MSLKSLAFVLALGGLLAMTLSARAEDPVFNLTIRDHRFEPAELQIPARTKVKLLIKNLDSTPEEFESHELHREKVVPPGQEVAVFIGPLDPGTYPFFGDFNPKTAQGKIVAK